MPCNASMLTGEYRGLIYGCDHVLVVGDKNTENGRQKSRMSKDLVNKGTLLSSLTPYVPIKKMFQDIQKAVQAKLNEIAHAPN